jgi:hypothetical protein
MDQDFTFLRRAEINPDRQGTISVKHVLIDSTGPHPFSTFVRLKIARNGADGATFCFIFVPMAGHRYVARHT